MLIVKLEHMSVHLYKYDVKKLDFFLHSLNIHALVKWGKQLSFLI